MLHRARRSELSVVILANLEESLPIGDYLEQVPYGSPMIGQGGGDY